MFSALFKINSLKRFVALLCCIVFSACYWAETEENPDYLPMDDSMYPYAGLPRLVIEIENFGNVDIDRRPARSGNGIPFKTPDLRGKIPRKRSSGTDRTRSRQF